MEDLTKVDLSFKKLFVPLTTAKVITIISLIGLIVYANMLFNGFAWDDQVFILSNPEIHLPTLGTIFGQSLFNTGYYRPVPALYLGALYTFFGANAFIYHFLQLALHIVNAVLLYIFFKTFFKKHISLLLTLCFLVHPIQVESVSYIASVGNPLFFLFGISAIILGLQKILGRKHLIFLTVLLLVTLLTKETGYLFLWSFYYSVFFLNEPSSAPFFL